MKKFLFSLVVLFLLTTALVGCSQEEAESKDGVKEIDFFHRWPTDPKNKYFKNAVAEFEEQNPNIKINTEAVLNDSYKEKIRIVLGSETPPDVFFSWSGEFAYNFARQDLAMDLTREVSEDKEWSKEIIDSSFGPFTLNDKLYGVPWSVDGKAFFYNKEIFAKHGLEEPKTWEEFIQVLDVLKDDSDVTPMSFGSKAPWTISHWIGTLNQRIVEPAVIEKDYSMKKAENKYTVQGYVTALEKLNELVPYFNEGVNSVDHEYARQLFKSGEAAISYMQLAEIGLVEPDLGENLGVFEFPKIEGGKGNSNVVTGAPEGIMISSKTEHPEAALKFVKFLTSKPLASSQLKEVSEYSAVEGTTIPENGASELQQKAVDQIVNADDLAVWFDTAVDIKIVDVYLSSVQLMLGGEKTPEKVMEDVQQAAAELN